MQYTVGRFVYAFSLQANRWGVLELKRPVDEGSSLPAGANIGENGMTIPEGNAIHFFNPKTGDWTHIDIQDNK